MKSEDILLRARDESLLRGSQSLLLYVFWVGAALIGFLAVFLYTNTRINSLEREAEAREDQLTQLDVRARELSTTLDGQLQDVESRLVSVDTFLVTEINKLWSAAYLGNQRQIEEAMTGLATLDAALLQARQEISENVRSLSEVQDSLTVHQGRLSASEVSLRDLGVSLERETLALLTELNSVSGQSEARTATLASQLQGVQESLRGIRRSITSLDTGLRTQEAAFGDSIKAIRSVVSDSLRVRGTLLRPSRRDTIP